MRAVPEGSIVRLGAGVFETRGFSPIYGDATTVGWLLKSRQRLLGSGIDATVVRLVLPMDDQSQTTAIYSGNAAATAFLEVRRLTVDCNAPAHQAPYGIFPAPVVCGAVGLYGSHLRLRHIRAINFCVQARAECFPLFLSSPDPDSGDTSGILEPVGADNIIEDCIVEMPGENNTHETTLISAHGDIYGNGRSCVVRHNYHNSSFANGWTPRLIPISQLDPSNPPLVTLTTSLPHAHSPGKALVVQGVKVAGSLSAVFNGIFAIESASATVLTYRLAATPESGTVDFSGATIGGSISAEWVGITGITYTTETDGTLTAVVTTSRPHRRNFKQNVKLNAVLDTAHQSTSFNDTFPIIAIISSTQFKIVRPLGAPAESDLLFFVDGIRASVGIDLMGRGAIGGTGCVTEGNAYHDCVFACYQDTGSTRDMVLRDNYASNIAGGVAFNFLGAFDISRSPSGIVAVESGTEKRGIFTTNRSISFGVNALVTIREAGTTALDSVNPNPYHGLALTVKQVDGERFQYAANDLPRDDHQERGRDTEAVPRVSSPFHFLLGNLRHRFDRPERASGAVVADGNSGRMAS
jgi:hypothetical protein